MLNLAVRQKKLAVNPCGAVEFPVSVKHSTRKPHYMTASEQQRIEFLAPGYLKHIIVIMTEMGLRPQKELLPMLKGQVDLENRLVHISDSKTENGIGDMPMTDLAYTAFKDQTQDAAASDYLFPRLTEQGSEPYLCSVKKAWRTTLRRVKVDAHRRLFAAVQDCAINAPPSSRFRISNRLRELCVVVLRLIHNQRVKAGCDSAGC